MESVHLTWFPWCITTSTSYFVISLCTEITNLKQHNITTVYLNIFLNDSGIITIFFFVYVLNYLFWILCIKLLLSIL